MALPNPSAWCVWYGREWGTKRASIGLHGSARTVSSHIAQRPRDDLCLCVDCRKLPAKTFPGHPGQKVQCSGLRRIGRSDLEFKFKPSVQMNPATAAPTSCPQGSWLASADIGTRHGPKSALLRLRGHLDLDGVRPPRRHAGVHTISVTGSATPSMLHCKSTRGPNTLSAKCRRGGPMRQELCRGQFWNLHRFAAPAHCACMHTVGVFSGKLNHTSVDGPGYHDTH